jgi:hypothetical protein
MFILKQWVTKRFWEKAYDTPLYQLPDWAILQIEECAKRGKGKKRDIRDLAVHLTKKDRGL